MTPQDKTDKSPMGMDVTPPGSSPDKLKMPVSKTPSSKIADKKVKPEERKKGSTGSSRGKIWLTVYRAYTSFSKNIFHLTRNAFVA